MNIIRGIVSTTESAAGKLARFWASGHWGQTVANREAFQHYGFSSRAKRGAENVIVCEGSVYIEIASDDRRYRIALQEGEVALYTDEGDKVHLQRNGQIVIKGGSKVIVESPLVEVGNAALEAIVNGESFQTLYNSHTHTGGFVAPTTPPVLPMITGTHTSLSVKAKK